MCSVYNLTMHAVTYCKHGLEDWIYQSACPQGSVTLKIYSVLDNTYAELDESV